MINPMVYEETLISKDNKMALLRLYCIIKLIINASTITTHTSKINTTSK